MTTREPRLLLLLSFGCIALSWAGCSTDNTKTAPLSPNPTPATPTPPATPPTAAQIAASSAIAALRGLITTENASFFGFDTPGDVDQATVGTPFEVSRVPLSSIRDFVQGQDAESVLIQHCGELFPIYIGTAPVSLITLLPDEQGQWHSERIGGRNRIVAIESAREADIVANQRTLQKQDYELIVVGTLNLHFVSHGVGANRQLRAVSDSPQFAKGQLTTLPQVISTLAPVVAKITGGLY